MTEIAPLPPSKSADPNARTAIVLIGLMGAGKTCVGRRLARRLDIPFVDTDEAIVEAAGCSIADIFVTYGEDAFRDCERRVIARLLNDGRQVLATGGGAFMDPETRALIRARGLSVWLRADLEILVERTRRKTHRPLLKDRDHEEVLAALMAARYPVYGEADVIVQSTREPADVTVERVMAAIRDHSAVGAGAVAGADMGETRT